jgi:hypothetical protein
MLIIDNRVPLWAEHACAYLGHTGPCMACELGAQATTARVPAVMRYACSACPACSYGRRNAAQEAVAAAAVGAVSGSAVSGTEQRCSNWPAGATDHACMKCNPGEIDRLNNLVAAAGSRYDATPTMGAYSSAAQEAKARDAEDIIRFFNQTHAAQEAKDRDARLAATLAERAFTRAEVLTVLGCLKTRWTDDGTERGGLRFRAAQQTLDEAIATFERMA